MWPNPQFPALMEIFNGKLNILSSQRNSFSQSRLHRKFEKLHNYCPDYSRNAGMGMASAMARVGSFSASYVIYLVSLTPNLLRCNYLFSPLIFATIQCDSSRFVLFRPFHAHILLYFNTSRCYKTVKRWSVTNH